MLKGLPRTGYSFRNQLVGIAALGTLGLALTASLTTAWVTSSRARAQMIAQGQQIAANLAEQSILALLYMSSKNAEKPLNTIMSFPDIEYAAVFDVSLNTLLAIGIEMPSMPETERFALSTQAPVVLESSSNWRFIVPVHTDTGAAPADNQNVLFQTEKPTRELIGYILVSMNKTTLTSLQKSIFISNIGIGLTFGCLMLIVLQLGIRHLTKPLYQLADIMKKTEEQGGCLYADLKGPQEISHMAGVFNRMMASIEERDKKLRRHQESLQSQIEIRTRELLLARDAALAASRHKSQFLAIITHELRTPLQAIMGYADVVREDLMMEGMDGQAAELDQVVKNAQTLLVLINSILNLAKMEAGKMDLKLGQIHLPDMVRKAIETVGPLLRQNGNRFELDFVENQPHLAIDGEKLFHCLINLLSNAGKFTSEGHIRLHITHEPQMLTLSVSDTGIGMTEEQQKIIFEEFRQIDGSTTRKVAGTGLGLAITKGFCELMGGRIEVESMPGEGSTFRIQIPLPVAETKASEKNALATVDAGSASFKPEPQDRILAPPTILLIDDDPVFLHGQVLALENAGCRVFTAEPSKALTRAKALRPNVISIDQRSSTLDCRRLLDELRSQPELSDIPIVMLTTFHKGWAESEHWHQSAMLSKIEEQLFHQAIGNSGTQPSSKHPHA